MKRLVLPDERPLDLVEGPSALGLLDVLVLDRLLIKFINADRVSVGQPTISHLLVGQFVLETLFKLVVSVGSSFVKSVRRRQLLVP